MIRGVDVTEDLTPFILSAEYQDAVKDEADSLSLTVAAPDDRFLNGWYPDKGDTLELLLGYPGDFIPSGVFEIDQTEISGSATASTVLNIKAISAGVTKALRTVRSDRHEDSSLRKIADKIADRHGLTVVGDIDPGLTIKHATQYRKTDLAFLACLAKDYGYVFSVRGNDLVFTEVYALEDRPAVTTISADSLISYGFTDKSTQSYGAATVRYSDPDTQKTTQYAREESTPETTEADTLEVFTTAKEATTANAKARAALHEKNTRKITGNLILPGTPSLLAGNNFTLTGLGVFDGTYHIEKSVHSLSPAAGYATTVNVKKIN